MYLFLSLFSDGCPETTSAYPTESISTVCLYIYTCTLPLCVWTETGKSKEEREKRNEDCVKEWERGKEKRDADNTMITMMMIRKRGEIRQHSNYTQKKEEKNATHLCPAYLSVFIFHQHCMLLLLPIDMLYRNYCAFKGMKFIIQTICHFSLSIMDVHECLWPIHDSKFLLFWFPFLFLFFPHSFTSSFSSSSFWLVDQPRNYLDVIF